jgi:hypothetical protein
MEENQDYVTRMHGCKYKAHNQVFFYHPATKIITKNKQSKGGVWNNITFSFMHGPKKVIRTHQMLKF